MTKELVQRLGSILSNKLNKYRMFQFVLVTWLKGPTARSAISALAETARVANEQTGSKPSEKRLLSCPFRGWMKVRYKGKLEVRG